MRSQFYATYYFAHNCCTVSLSYSVTLDMLPFIPLHCKQWYQLPELNPSNSNYGFLSCINISIHTQVLLRYYNRFTALWTLSRTTRVPGTRRNIHPLAPVLWSSIIPYLLPSSIVIHGIFPVEFTCLTVCLHNLSPNFLWSSSWPGTFHFIPHTFFTQSLCSFHNRCSYHRKLFYCSTEIMSSNLSLSLSPLLGILSCSLMPHIHLTILISALTQHVT